ncbi:MAG: hypothetical protein JXA24_05780 [Proteobacteria bacterium]|nr:hypothetical protein [Pseudomonadota bacterium]
MLEPNQPITDTTVAFVWHMHQPYYRDTKTGECAMPWVRLHGTHSYYDMLRLYRQHPRVKGTINFVPSLIRQLFAYVEEDAGDAFLDHTLVPADSLNARQKIFLLRHFFSANAERKIDPCGTYKKLKDRLGHDQSNIDYDQAVRFFSAQDYRDLQVYFNLVWFGFAAREEIPELERMLLEARHFSEEDKAFVLEAQRRILKNLMEEIRIAAGSENVELTTTPFYHPILPLCIDTDFAKRCMPKAGLPHRFAAPALAREQLSRALDSMERWFGARPCGIWPAEGSVCPEMIPMLADAGVKWIATDDMVLAHSFPEAKPVDKHRPYLASHGGKEVGIVFRDHGLSDLIGFVYGRKPAADAVDDFVSHLSAIDAAKPKDAGKKLVTVILDGENPWEHYPDSGREFLRTLFERIESDGIRTTRLCDYIRSNPPAQRIEKLHTGSWIDANFYIWIGKPQKNQAWDYLRRSMEELGGRLDTASADDGAQRALDSFLAAMGSDWFWWFDEDFESPFKGDFDRIFRSHLKNAFEFLGMKVPLFLFEPIYRYDEHREALIEPPGFISPDINGFDTSFFEWANAARMTVHGRTSGAMAQSSTDPFEAISLGFNAEAFFLRIEPIDRERDFSLTADDALLIGLHGERGHRWFRLQNEGAALDLRPVNEEGDSIAGFVPRFAAGELLEMAFPFEDLGLKAGDRATITLALYRKGVEVRRYSHMRFVVPDETYDRRMWGV